MTPDKHLEGHHAANFRGDIQDMLRAGLGVKPADRDFLERLSQSAPVRDASCPDGYRVEVSVRPWTRFLEVRSRFLEVIQRHRAFLARSAAPAVPLPLTERASP